MLDEFGKIVKVIAHDPKYLALLKKILIIVAIFGVLILTNRFLIVKFADRGEFFVSLERAKEVFWGSTSVYSGTMNSTAKDLKIIGVSHLSASTFNLPLFSVLFYLPFSLIRDFDWSLALWLAANQIICYFMLSVSLEILNKKLNEISRIVATVIMWIAYLLLVNILKTDLALVQMLLVLLGYRKIRDNDFIFAGILLGLAFFNPFELFIPLAIMVALNFYNGRGLVNGWILISVVLLSLIFVVFDSRWLLEMVKTLFLKPEIYPFIGFRQYLNRIFPNINTSLVELIPVAVYVWIIIEWLRTPKENYLQELWVLALGFTLTPLLNMWDSPYCLAGYAFVFIYTISLWYERAPRKFRVFSAGIYLLVLVVLPAIRMITSHALITNQAMIGFNLVVMVILLLNLYWVRLWVMNPYFSVNKLDEI